MTALALVLTACGGGAADDAEVPGGTPSSKAVALTMKDVCPLVEDALPAHGFRGGVRTFEKFLTALDDLHARADNEAQNGLEKAQKGTAKLIAVLETGATGLYASEGEDAFLNGLTNLSQRCKAAGSSALQ